MVQSLPIYLASQSPRRKAILEQLGISFKLVPVSGKDPQINFNGSPALFVKKMAEKKAEQALLHSRSLVKKLNGPTGGFLLTFDTIVYFRSKTKGLIFNKPKSEKEATKIIQTLNGKKHSVYTGMALLNLSNGQVTSHFSRTFVKFRVLQAKEIKSYIQTHDWRDKAGGYGIQSAGAALIEWIHGCYYNVVGLPVGLLLRHLPI